MILPTSMVTFQELQGAIPLDPLRGSAPASPGPTWGRPCGPAPIPPPPQKNPSTSGSGTEITCCTKKGKI